MGIILALTVAVGLLCFWVFAVYIKRNIVRGRPSGTGSVRVTDPVLAREEPRDFFQSIMPIARPNSQATPIFLREPEAGVPDAQAKPGKAKEVIEENESTDAADPSFPKTVKRIDRSGPTVFHTHKHLVPLAAQLAEEVWPARREQEGSRLKSLPGGDLSPERAAALKPHHAALRLFIVLDASFSVKSFRKEHRAFHELLYYHIMRKCGSRELARGISAGVRKYTRNAAQIFGEKNEKIMLARLSGVFWGGVQADGLGSFVTEDVKSFHAAFAMACDFTVRYDSVLGRLEEHCGVRQARPAFALVLPREAELSLNPESALCENVPDTHHGLLDWIEDTDAFQRLYDETADGGGLDVCYLCGGDPDMAQSVILLNGWRVHERCFDMLTQRLAMLKTVQEARQLFKLSPNLLCAHRLVNVYWPGSPPDWENRREMIFERADGSCENCGRAGGGFEIRRVHPLERKGNHSNDNFLCLCPECGEELGRHQETGAAAEWKGFYRQKLETIEAAMSGERKLLFTYNKEETRVISPKEWAKRRGYWLIRGYCYLYNDERLFSPRKMTDLKIL